METVSVIITCYNLERYIGAAIESVLGQRFDDPVEIIVVDDNSNDGSADIIKSFPQVRYVRTAANSGVLLAMLEGLRMSSGQFIFLLDGDDVWEPQKLTHSMATFRSDARIALTTHDLSFVDEADRPLDRISRPEQVLNPLRSGAQSSRIICGILHHLDFVWLGSALGMRRSLADPQGFDDWARQLPDPANTYQDWPLAFWIVSQPGSMAGYDARKLFRYRLHGANHSGDARDVGRALRNLKRAKNTIDAMVDIANRRRLPHDVGNSLRGRSDAYGYLIDLYSGKRATAFTGFLKVLPHFVRRRQATKELVRLFSVLIMGPNRFASLAGRRIPIRRRITLHDKE
jgi:glycosyltransferase involved in cell wall biosynthesis